MNRKTAIVTGGSSGIGRECAAELNKRGYTVYEFSRRNITLEGVIHKTVDVTDENGVIEAVNEIAGKEGKIDLLVNCAGFGISGAVEFTPVSEAKRQFDVNFFGTVNVCRAVIPHMRKKLSGKIINTSSVAAVAHIPFQTFYSASKAAIESYTNALANELRPFGIGVTCIQPGDISTGFTDARDKSADGDDIYGGRISKSVSGMEKDERKGMKAEDIGRYIVKIAEKKKVRPIYTPGASYKILSTLCRIFPQSVRNYIVGMLYAG